MAEEVSPESKLYVKEEIEKSRKEFKEDLKEAQSKATKTFAIVALVVGLLASLGIIGNISIFLSRMVEKETLERISKKLSEMANNEKTHVATTRNGYAYAGGFKFVWGERMSTEDADGNYDDQRFSFAPDNANNPNDYNFDKCFVVITDIAGEVYNTDYSGFNLRRDGVWRFRGTTPEYLNSGRKPFLTTDENKNLIVPFTFIALGTELNQ